MKLSKILRNKNIFKKHKFIISYVYRTTIIFAPSGPTIGGSECH